MAKSPQHRDPAKHSKKDPAKPTRAKASRPDSSPLDPSLADLLNPAIGQGRAGLGSQTGSPSPLAGEGQAGGSNLKPPPDNSWDRRADFANAHKARASVARGFGEAPQQGYVGKTPVSARRARSRSGARAWHRGARTTARKSPPVPTICPRASCKSSGGGAFGGLASQHSLEQLAARRPGGISRRRRRGQNLDAAPAAAAGQIRRRPPPGHQIRLRPEGRPAAGDRGTGRGRAAQRPHPGAARRHRLRQDLHHGQGDRGDAAPRPRSWRPTRRWRRSSTASSGVSFPTTRSSISSPITTTTSRKPMSRAPTPISRRNPRSTSRSTACATRRRARCWSATT